MTVEQEKLIKHVERKLDRDADLFDFASLLGAEVFSVDTDEWGAAYDYFNNEILISQKVEEENDEESLYNFFFHEFGHIIHEIALDDNYYLDYERRNLRVTQVLEAEQQADLIGRYFWLKRFPDKEPPEMSYFTKEGVLFLVDYYGDFFENDLGILLPKEEH